MKEKAYGPTEAHEGRRGFPPLAHGAKGGALAPSLAAPFPPFGSLVLHGGGEEVAPPFLAYIRGGRVPFFIHPIEFFLSIFLRPRADSPCLEFAPGWGFHHHSNAVALPESGSGSVFFPLLFWFGARRDIGCTVRV